MMEEMDKVPHNYNPFYVIENEAQIGNYDNFDAGLYPGEQEEESEDNEAEGEEDNDHQENLDQEEPEGEGNIIAQDMNNERTMRIFEAHHPILHRRMMGSMVPR